MIVSIIEITTRYGSTEVNSEGVKKMKITINGFIYGTNEKDSKTLEVDLNKDNFTIHYAKGLTRVEHNGVVYGFEKDNFNIS